MKESEHLLTILSEECNEVGQAVSKSLRFGLKDCHPKNNNKANEELIIEEYIQLVGTMNLIIDEGIIRPIAQCEYLQGVRDKQGKIKRWLEYAKEKGTIDDR